MTSQGIASYTQQSTINMTQLYRMYIATFKFTMTVWSPGLHCITYPICNPPGSSPGNSVHDNVKESEVTMTAAKFCGGIVGPTHYHM